MNRRNVCLSSRVPCLLCARPSHVETQSPSNACAPHVIIHRPAPHVAVEIRRLSSRLAMLPPESAEKVQSVLEKPRHREITECKSVLISPRNGEIRQTKTLFRHSPPDGL